jgi:hypothetical protein
MDTGMMAMTDWYHRDNCTPDEKMARAIIDKIGNRGYLAAGADLSFISLLIQAALAAKAKNACLLSKETNNG